MSDRMVVMNKGKIVEMGDADTVYRHPISEYTKNLISSIPKGQLSDIQENVNKKKLIIK